MLIVVVTVMESQLYPILYISPVLYSLQYLVLWEFNLRGLLLPVHLISPVLVPIPTPPICVLYSVPPPLAPLPCTLGCQSEVAPIPHPFHHPSLSPHHPPPYTCIV